MVDELIMFLPHEKVFRHAAKYHAHLKHLEDLQRSLYKNMVSDI